MTEEQKAKIILAREHLQLADAQLAALLAPPAPPMLYRVRVIVDALNVRSGPAATFADVGDVLRDQLLDVYEVAPNGWLRIQPAEQRWVSGNAAYTVRV